MNLILQHFNDGRLTHAAGDAERRKAVLESALLHLVYKGYDDPAAGRSDRMSEGDRAAVDVDDVHLILPAELLDAADGLGGKRLVQLDQLDIVVGKSGVGKSLRYRADRAKAHDARIVAGRAHTDYAGNRLETEFLRLFLAHEENGGSSVVAAGGGSGSNSTGQGAVVEQSSLVVMLDVEYGLQLRHLFEIGITSRELVRVKDDGAFCGPGER